MNRKSVLVVDDEKNIRLTLTHALASLDLDLDTAANGQEALVKLEQKPFHVVLLDLKMPGLDGMAVLRRLKEIRPGTRAVIITAHGTVDSAVEAMKLGAVDYLQKPFSPADIRELVTQVLNRDDLRGDLASDYETLFELAKKHINERDFGGAERLAGKAAELDPSRPEAFNLLGALAEMRGDREAAARLYSVAHARNPLYGPSLVNWFRIIKRVEDDGRIALGEDTKTRK